MSQRLLSIHRYVVKGLTGEPLPEIALQSGRGIANDRRYALALHETKFDEDRPVPLPKTQFVMLARHARLAGLASRYDDAERTLTLYRGETLLTRARLDDPQGRAAIEQCIADHMGDEIGGRPRLVEGRGHRFTDVSVVSPAMMEAVSLVNLASVRALAAALGRTVDPRRFRGNFLADGIAPWAEFDWLDREITIGSAKFTVAKRTRRCPATAVNLETCERDIDVPMELVNRFGHGDMGVYLLVHGDGVVRAGDEIRA
jgi:uncharacterized protein YcbX